VVATGVAADGHREVLGFDVGDSEDGAVHWPRSAGCAALWQGIAIRPGPARLWRGGLARVGCHADVPGCPGFRANAKATKLRGTCGVE
jgi:hypothetical protein